MPTRDELLEEAGEYDVTGRHSMSKDELEKAIERAKSGEGAEQQEQGSEVSPEEAQAVLEGEIDYAEQAREVVGETGTDVEAQQDESEEEEREDPNKGAEVRGVGFLREDIGDAESTTLEEDAREGDEDEDED